MKYQESGFSTQLVFPEVSTLTIGKTQPRMSSQTKG